MLIDKFAGLRNDVSTERFEPNDLSVATNVLIDDSLRIERRPGMTLLAAGARHSLWAQDSHALYVAGSTLYALQPDMSAVSLRSDLTPDLPMSYCLLNDRVYYANGAEQGVIDEGYSRAWGIAVPSLPVATPASGSLDPGSYQYSVTHLMSDGQESGALPAGVVDVVDGGISFQFAALPAGVLSRVLYLSTADGETLYEALVWDGPSATVTAMDDVVPLETMNLSPPLDGVHLVVEYAGHLLCAHGSLLLHSQAYGPEYFDHRDYLAMDSRIQMIAPTDNGVFIGTAKGIAFLTGRDPEEWSFSELARYGVIPGSLAYAQARLLGFDGVGEGIAALWLSEKGICVGFAGGGFYNLSDPRYQGTDAPTRAAALIRNYNGSTHYIASY